MIRSATGESTKKNCVLKESPSPIKARWLLLQLRKQTLSQNNDKHPVNSFKQQQQQIRRASTIVSHKGIMQTAPGKSRRSRSRDLQEVESAHQLKQDCWSAVLGNTRLSKGTIRANCSFRLLHHPRRRAQKNF
jgi:hypothetical protein